MLGGIVSEADWRGMHCANRATEVSALNDVSDVVTAVTVADRVRTIGPSYLVDVSVGEVPSSV